MKQKITPALAFHWLTPIYDIANDLLGLGRPLTRRVVGVANIKAGERILDVGCGTASLLLEIKSRFPAAEVTGIDADPDILRIARKKLERAGLSAKLIEGYAQELPFPPGYFDLVTSTLIFHHLPTEVKKQAAREIYRVLKDGGRFILADFGKPETLLYQVLLNLSTLIDGRERARANLEGLLPSLLEEAGFGVTEAGRRYRGIQFLLARKLTPLVFPGFSL